MIIVLGRKGNKYFTRLYTQRYNITFMLRDVRVNLQRCEDDSSAIIG